MSEPFALPLVFTGGHHIPTLEALHDELLGTAAKVVAAGREVEAMLFVLSAAGRLAIIPAAGLSKDGVAAFQRGIVRDPQVRACAVVVEAWMSTGRPGGELYAAASLDPERTEAVVVSIMTAGRQALTFSPIERPANTVRPARFAWLDEADGVASGRFVRAGGLA